MDTLKVVQTLVGGVFRLSTHDCKPWMLVFCVVLPISHTFLMPPLAAGHGTQRGNMRMPSDPVTSSCCNLCFFCGGGSAAAFDSDSNTLLCTCDSDGSTWLCASESNDSAWLRACDFSGASLKAANTLAILVRRTDMGDAMTAVPLVSLGNGSWSLTLVRRTDVGDAMSAVPLVSLGKGSWSLTLVRRTDVGDAMSAVPLVSLGNGSWFLTAPFCSFATRSRISCNCSRSAVDNLLMRYEHFSVYNARKRI